MRHILFRLNAGSNYGLGHYYRTISLANLMKARNWRVHFVHNPDAFWEDNFQKEFHYVQIETDPDCADEDLILDLVESHKIDIVFVDGNIFYQENLWHNLSSKGVRLVNYQNLSDAKAYCDCYILPSIHQQQSFFSDFGYTRPKIFQGLKYFTFNEIILEQEKHIPTDKVINIAITTGGSDPNNMTKLLYYIFIKNTNYQFNFYLGDNYMYRDEIENWKKSSNIELKKYNIREILNNDILISAFGVSTYEFMALGMPIIAIAHQESNALAANFLAEKTQAIISLGQMDQLIPDELNRKIDDLAKDKSLVHSLIENGGKVIDLNGLNRVFNILENEW